MKAWLINFFTLIGYFLFNLAVFAILDAGSEIPPSIKSVNGHWLELGALTVWVIVTSILINPVSKR